jgi:hypothetical protein
MPMAGNIRGNIAAICSHRAPAIVRARQNGIKFAANHLFDQPANPVTDACFDRIKPIVEKMGVAFGRRLRKLGLRGNAGNGVVSCPALERRAIRG